MAGAWGRGGSARSCDALLKRIEHDDPTLVELVILPLKTFGSAEMNRLSSAIDCGANTHLRSISASGHTLPPQTLKRFGLALSTQAQGIIGSGAGCDKQTCGIQSLAVGCRDMGDEGAVALCEGLASSNGGLLRSLDMGWKNLGQDGFRAIGTAFGASKFLTHLNLSRNTNAGSDGVTQLCNAANGTVEEGDVAFPCLEQLTLSECDIGPPGITSLVCIIIGPVNSSGKCVRSKRINLVIGSNSIGSEGCRSLSKLCTTPQIGSLISNLQLSRCSINDEGISLLAAAAMNRACIGLSALDLSDNLITEVGAKVLGESLMESWPDLIELQLADNNLGQGVTFVIEALVGSKIVNSGDPSAYDGALVPKGKNSTLKNLNLTNTNCGVRGAATALMTGSVTTLRLFNNRLRSDGFQSIAPLLHGGHPSIVNLDLGGNSANEDAVVTLLNSIANNVKDDGTSVSSTLSVLEIGGNTFGEKAMEALRHLKSIWPRLDVAHDKQMS